MSKGVKWGIAIALMLFVGYVVAGSVLRAQYSCEVCLEFDGREVCRAGAGASEAEALQAAQESACGGNAQGMTELIRCRNAEPLRSQCTAP
jgi:hypothetical protein